MERKREEVRIWHQSWGGGEEYGDVKLRTWRPDDA